MQSRKRERIDRMAMSIHHSRAIAISVAKEEDLN